MLTPEQISAQQLINDYDFASHTASVHILEVFTYALSFGPVLILSIVALKRLRQRHSPVPSRSSKWLSRVILTQLIFITLRFTCSVTLKVLLRNDAHYSVMDDGSIQMMGIYSIYSAELGLICSSMLSARAVELLASTVLVWRAWVIYPDLFLIRFILVLVWVIDLAVEVLYFGAFITGAAREIDVPLSRIALYASRWTSFALNLLVTLSVAYRTWKFKNVLTDAGLTTRKSTSYKILARLVETGLLMLATQLLLAILATTYTSVDFSNLGYDAMLILAELSLVVINAHPAAMSLVAADILLEEGRGSRDNESSGVSGCMAFRVTETGLTTGPPRSSVLSVVMEK
ncbi:hypothetical protein DL96DRAFT_540205 [Flagelloscypha sp. PMI_526]|nr:hypothetical protein DL96DRAFT_540205 [Flagelloscypha sp. PMI_526]